MKSEVFVHQAGFVLELLAPDGVAERQQIFASALPTLTSSPNAGGDTLCDLIVIAPTEVERRVEGWLDSAVQHAARNLKEDGVVYVLVPRRWRLLTARLLHLHSLSIEQFMLHHPNVSSSSYIVPLRAGPLGYVFSAVVPTRAWRHQLARLVLGIPGGANLLASLLPEVALVVRRRGARPLAEWLFSSSTGQAKGDLVLRLGRREQSGRLTVYRFHDDAQYPDAIVKLSDPTADPARSFCEAENLSRLGAVASEAGAMVPSVLEMKRVGSRLGLFESAIEGKLLAVSLAGQPARLHPFMGKLVDWLIRWNVATRVVKPIEVQDVESAILEPARCIAPFLDEGEAYLDWLEAYCARIVNLPLSFVAAHNDLTMANILEGPEGELGIVDWEAARPTAFPLMDFYYAMVDAVMTTQSDSDRLTTFRSCFETGGINTVQIKQYEQRFVCALNLQPHLTILCFHACWLHHAANEVRQTASTAQRPFLKIAQWLAFHRTAFAAPIRTGSSAQKVSFATVSNGPNPH